MSKSRLQTRKQLVGTLEERYLDFVYSIFKARQHAIVLAEEFALRWMSVEVSPDEVTITPLPPTAVRFFNTNEPRVWTC